MNAPLHHPEPGAPPVPHTGIASTRHREPAGQGVPDAAPAVSVQGLTKRYGSQVAVDDLSFDVAAGSIVGFLGPNGAGKSTTLRMILGLTAPSAGSATLSGRASSPRGRAPER